MPSLRQGSLVETTTRLDATFPGTLHLMYRKFRYRMSGEGQNDPEGTFKARPRLPEVNLVNHPAAERSVGSVLLQRPEPVKEWGRGLRGEQPTICAPKELQPERESMGLQRLTIDDPGAGPRRPLGRFDQYAGVRSQGPFDADAHPVGADILDRGVFSYDWL